MSANEETLEVKTSNYGTLENEENGVEKPPPAPAPQKPHSIMGILFIMLGSFSFSLMFLTVKLMADTNTFTLVFYRSLIQIGISLSTLLWEGTNPLGPRDGSTRFYLVLRAVFGAAAVCAWFFGIQVLPLPDAVTLQFTTPVFAAAFAVCIVGEQWKPMDIVGAVVCLTGVAFIAHPTWLFGKPVTDEQDESNTAAGLALKALAVAVTTGGAAMAGLAYVLVRKIGDRASAVVMVLYYGSLSIPMVFLGSGFFEGTWAVWGDLSHFTAVDYIYLLLMGLGGYGGQWFTNLGLQMETAATATLATSTQIVWTYVFELLFLHENIDKWSLAGTGLIMGYMLIVAAMKMGAAKQVAAEVTEEETRGLLPSGGDKVDYSFSSSGASSGEIEFEA